MGFLKVIFSLSAILFSASLFADHHCPNLSGDYRCEYRRQGQDRVLGVNITQEYNADGTAYTLSYADESGDVLKSTRIIADGVFRESRGYGISVVCGDNTLEMYFSGENKCGSKIYSINENDELNVAVDFTTTEGRRVEASISCPRA